MSDVKWPAAVVAVAIVAMITTITVVAIVKYDTVDDALKMWSGLSAVVGVVTGAFVAFFFTRGTVEQARQTAETAKASAEAAHRTAESIAAALPR